MESGTMRHSIRIEGEFFNLLAWQVKELIIKNHDFDIDIDNCPKINNIINTVDFSFLINLATCLSSLIVTIILCVEQIEKNRWTKHRLMKVIRNRMFDNDVLDFKILKISGLRNLKNREPSPCIIKLQDNVTKCIYNVDIFYDEEIVVFKLNSQ